jgi:hypothetical protein
MKAFVTGSRVYGTPRANSDLDFATLVSREDFDLMLSLLLPHSHGCEFGDYPDGCAVLRFGDYPDGCAVLRFGKLNLLLFTDAVEFKSWHTATEHLKSIKPVTRDQAIAAISAQVRTDGVLYAEVANANGSN